MKIKEFPASFVNSIKLRMTRRDKLGVNAAKSAVDVVISLTSIESRLKVIDLTIRSLLDQNVSFSHINLWLHHDLKTKLPSRLVALACDRFRICYSDETCSHRKLLETLRLGEHQTVVTCDDDMMYPKDWLRRLLQSHIKHPGAIVAHECRVINYDTSGKLQPYKTWHSQAAGETNSATLAIGYGGVLYPPNVMHSDVFDAMLYAKLAPRADDLWYKAQSLRLGVSVFRTECPAPKPMPIAGSQWISLKKHNVREDGNYLQWKKLDEHYCLAKRLNERSST